jgi:hypothetical protein
MGKTLPEICIGFIPDDFGWLEKNSNVEFIEPKSEYGRWGIEERDKELNRIFKELGVNRPGLNFGLEHAESYDYYYGGHLSNSAIPNHPDDEFNRWILDEDRVKDLLSIKEEAKEEDERFERVKIFVKGEFR